MKKLRSKTNKTYFEDIPKPITNNLSLPDKIIFQTNNRHKLLKKRIELVSTIAQLRKQLYNLSKSINKIDENISILLEKYNE